MKGRAARSSVAWRGVAVCGAGVSCTPSSRFFTVPPSWSQTRSSKERRRPDPARPDPARSRRVVRSSELRLHGQYLIPSEHSRLPHYYPPTTPTLSPGLCMAYHLTQWCRYVGYASPKRRLLRAVPSTYIALGLVSVPRTVKVVPSSRQ